MSELTDPSLPLSNFMIYGCSRAFSTTGRLSTGLTDAHQLFSRRWWSWVGQESIQKALVVKFQASVVLNMARSQSICPKPKSCPTDCSELWFPVVCGSGTRSLMCKPEPFLPTAKSQNTPCYRRWEKIAHNWFYQPGTLLNLNRAGSVRWIPPSSFWLSVPTSVECL